MREVYRLMSVALLLLALATAIALIRATSLPEWGQLLLITLLFLFSAAMAIHSADGGDQ